MADRTPISNEDGPVDELVCQLIYWNLIELHYRNESDLGERFLREFYQTRRCDQFHNMKPYRDGLENYLGTDGASEKTTRRTRDYILF
ncbi:hypothetical protein AKO1_004855 [Acrasis kona]|uniref:Uncharacterized protein n=1 Tax=Acrasis kona TaxID=1008807 RepID=A0AAW2Z387_9EUKA